MKVAVNVVRLAHFRGDLPKYQTSGASGIDVSAAIEAPMEIKAGERGIVPTGLTVEIPFGYEIQVRPRSGLAFRQGVTVLNTPGTIDSDYRGEIKIILVNLGKESFTIHPGDRIAQFVLAPVIQCEFKEVSQAQATECGAGGFGSTGIGTSRTI